MEETLRLRQQQQQKHSKAREEAYNVDEGENVILGQ